MRPALLACTLFVLTASCFSQSLNKGVVFKADGVEDVNNGQIYWFFYLGGDTNGTGLFGSWSITDQSFKLQSADKTISYTGTIMAGSEKIPIDAHCNLVSSTLIGTYKNLNHDKNKYHINAQALYTITECDIHGQFVDQHWNMGGSLVVYP